MTYATADETLPIPRYWIGAGLVLAILLSVVPILAHPNLPLIDLPNHIARHYIAANPETALSVYYDYELAANGNSTGDLLWLVAGRHFFDPYTFSSILLALYAANLVLATMVLGRVFQDRWTAWPLVAILVVFNAPFFWGFQNFLLAVPLALYALAGWIWYENARPWVRALVFMPVAFAIYQFHVLGFLGLLAGIFGREVHRLIQAGSNWPLHFKTHLVSATPFLPPIGLALAGALAAEPNIYGNMTHYGTLQSRFDMLVSPVATASADAPAVLGWTGAFIILALGAAFLTLRKSSGPRLVLAPKAVGPICALAILCLAMPTILDGVGFVHIRFPVVLVAVLLAATSWRGVSSAQSVAIALVFISLAVWRSASVESYAEQHSDDIAELATALSEVPPGARLLPVRMTPLSPGRTDWHIQAHAVPISEAFVPTLFRGAHGLKVNPDWWHLTMAQGMSMPAQFILGDAAIPSERLNGYWPDGISSFTHLLALDPLPPELTQDADLKLLSTNGRFSVYAIGGQP